MSFFAAASRNQTRLILVGAAVLLSLGMGCARASVCS